MRLALVATVYDGRAMPTFANKGTCPKCKNTEAYFRQVQPTPGIDDEVLEYYVWNCTECGATITDLKQVENLTQVPIAQVPIHR